MEIILESERLFFRPHELADLDSYCAMGAPSLRKPSCRSFSDGRIGAKGLAGEAAAAFVKFGWEELQLSRIVAAVEVGNGASVRILEKLGFELVATERGPRRSFFTFALANPGSRKG